MKHLNSETIYALFKGDIYTLFNETNSYICGLISNFEKVGKKYGFIKRFFYEDGLEHAYLPITPSEIDNAY